MSQIIYGILGVLLVTFLALNMQRGQLHAEDRMIVNEVTTELTGVAYGVLDLVGRLSFDENTDESKQPQPVMYPVITSTNQLTPEASFGGCTALTLVDPTCDDVDDFDGLTGTATVGGLTYNYSVTVRYVDPANPATASGSPTYAKEVEVEVTSPELLVGGSPLPVTLHRLYTYNRHTN